MIQFYYIYILKIKDNIEINETKTTGLRLYASDLIRVGSSGSYINNRFLK